MSAQEQRRRLVVSAIKDFILVKFTQGPDALYDTPTKSAVLFDATPVPLAKKIAR